MTCAKLTVQGLEWSVKVPNGSSVHLQSSCAERSRISAIISKVSQFLRKGMKIGTDDPRKVIHCIKVGLALTLVSIFYYTRPLYNGVGGASMWAIMTVVVVFEFTVGGSLYKGANRAMATFSAGALAAGLHWLATKSGKTTDHIVLGSSAFILSSAATFSRFIPTIKARFDYGVLIFILTFNLVAVSGFRVEELLVLAQRRLLTILIGICICHVVCIVVCPVWAGQELHNLITRNMEKLADSLEACVAVYFREDDIADTKENSCQKLQGYKSVLNSKSSEESMANLARWEPSHGNFRFRHPWSRYLKISAAMRSCAYCIESLSCFIQFENQLPDQIKGRLNEACTNLSSNSSKVLKELVKSMKTMKKSSSIHYLVGEMSNAVDELQVTMKSVSQAANMMIIEALPLVTISSLLIDISSRIEGTVDAVEDLADLACFHPVDCDKLEICRPTNRSITAMPPSGENQVEMLQKV